MELPCPMQALGVNLSPSRFIKRMVLVLIGERENENEIEKAVLMFYVNCWQQAYSCDSSALQRKMVLFINLLAKGLPQDINEDGGSI